jgi:hypothetical protein
VSIPEHATLENKDHDSEYAATPKHGHGLTFVRFHFSSSSPPFHRIQPDMSQCPLRQSEGAFPLTKTITWKAAFLFLTLPSPRIRSFLPKYLGNFDTVVAPKPTQQVSSRTQVCLYCCTPCSPQFQNCITSQQTMLLFS